MDAPDLWVNFSLNQWKAYVQGTYELLPMKGPGHHGPKGGVELSGIIRKAWAKNHSPQMHPKYWEKYQFPRHSYNDYGLHCQFTRIGKEYWESGSSIKEQVNFSTLSYQEHLGLWGGDSPTGSKIGRPRAPSILDHLVHQPHLLGSLSSGLPYR